MVVFLLWGCGDAERSRGYVNLEMWETVRVDNYRLMCNEDTSHKWQDVESSKLRTNQRGRQMLWHCSHFTYWNVKPDWSWSPERNM